MSYERIGGRKFVLCVATLISANVLAWFGKITPDVYQWLIAITVAAYITGNAGQKIGMGVVSKPPES